MGEKKRNIIRVDGLVIYADKVTVIDSRKDDDEKDHDRRREPPRRDPWDFFWGRSGQEIDRDEERD